jgi:short-subunit dehydrogenase
MTATEVFLDQLRANGGGDLVNVSSVAGRVAPAGFAAYAATKWGINGWSEALRVELQPDVRVIVIVPSRGLQEIACKWRNRVVRIGNGCPARALAGTI